MLSFNFSCLPNVIIPIQSLMIPYCIFLTSTPLSLQTTGGQFNPMPTNNFNSTWPNSSYITNSAAYPSHSPSSSHFPPQPQSAPQPPQPQPTPPQQQSVQPTQATYYPNNYLNSNSSAYPYGQQVAPNYPNLNNYHQYANNFTPGYSQTYHQGGFSQ